MECWCRFGFVADGVARAAGLRWTDGVGSAERPVDGGSGRVGGSRL